MGKFLNNSNSNFLLKSIKLINSDLNSTFAFGGIFPILIINWFSSGSSHTKIAAFPDEIASVYFSSAFSFLITLDFTLIESSIFAVKEENNNPCFLETYIFNSIGFFEEFVNNWVRVVFENISFISVFMLADTLFNT